MISPDPKPFVRSTSSRQIRHDADRLRKNRKIVDHHLRKIGRRSFHRDLRLSDNGLCFFPHQRFIIAIEVPDENPNVCFLYTMVCRLHKNDTTPRVLQMAMELNYMQTHTLGLAGDEVNLCVTLPVAHLQPHELKEALADFLELAVDLNQRLEAVQQGGRRRTRSTPSLG